jgi:hypothetical protein
VADHIITTSGVLMLRTTVRIALISLALAEAITGNPIPAISVAVSTSPTSPRQAAAPTHSKAADGGLIHPGPLLSDKIRAFIAALTVSLAARAVARDLGHGAADWPVSRSRCAGPSEAGARCGSRAPRTRRGHRHRMRVTNT